MGLVILGLLALYILISILVVIGVIKYSKKNGKSALHWAGGVALVLYLIPFWDWLPTVVMHRYYCSTEAGFWIYKTVDQWKQENPGVMETLSNQDTSTGGQFPSWPREFVNGKKLASINQRFAINYRDHLSSTDERELFLNNWRWQADLVDKVTGTVLARQIDFSSGNGYVGGEPPARFWLQKSHCEKNFNSLAQFKEFIDRIKGVKK